jgi:hypothetical protein
MAEERVMRKAYCCTVPIRKSLESHGENCERGVVDFNL